MSLGLCACMIKLMVAAVFVCAGSVKVFPQLLPTTHTYLQGEYVKYAKLHPAARFGYTINPHKLMTHVGMFEVTCSVLLLVGPRITKLLSHLVLMSIVIGGMCFEYALQENPLAHLAGLCVILLFLFVSLNFSMRSLYACQQPRQTEEQSEDQQEKKKDK